MWDFEHGDAARDFQIDYTVPSSCAAALAANEADIGIIPSFTYAEIPGLVIIPNVAIAARDRVRSILLISKKPIQDVRTVATDTSSRTSVALLQVLFAKYFGGERELTPHAPDLQEMLRSRDAALLIGDAALRISTGDGYYVYDLAHLWCDFTGKPFVFAFWALRLDSLDRKPEGLDLARIFQRSRDHGLEPRNIDVIAREWSARLGLGEDDIRCYLTNNIHYYLDRNCHAGLRLFLENAQEIGLIPTVPDLRFLGPLAFGGAST